MMKRRKKYKNNKKILVLVDLNSSALKRWNWYFNNYRKVEGYHFNFVAAKPDKRKLSEYVKKRKSIEPIIRNYNPKYIIVMGNSGKLFNPKAEFYSFSHIKTKIYDIDEKNNLIITDNEIELYVFPSIIHFIEDDASYSFKEALLQWFFPVLSFPISKKILKENENIEYYSHSNLSSISEINYYWNQSNDEVEQVFKSIIQNSKNDFPLTKFISFDTEFFNVRNEKPQEQVIKWYNFDILVYLVSIGYYDIESKKIKSLVLFYPKYKKIIQKYILKFLEEGFYVTGLNVRLDLHLIFRDIFFDDMDKYREWYKRNFEKLKIIDLRHFLIAKDNSKIKEVSLKTLSSFYLYEYPYQIDFSEIFKKAKEAILKGQDEPDDLVWKYSAYDAITSLALVKKFTNNGLKLNSRKEFLNYMLNVSKMLFDMTFRGWKLDIKKLNETKMKVDENLNKIRNIFKDKFQIDNPNSIKQLQNFLSKFKEVREYFPRTAKSNQISVKTSFIMNNFAEIKKRFSDKKELVEFFDLYYKYRLLRHLNDAFLVPLKNFADKNYIIHPNFSEFNIVTGRIVSRDPCVQQLPTEENAKKKLVSEDISFPEYLELAAIKENLFIPSDKDKVLLFMDLSQAEVRIAQLISQDEELYDALKKEDLYSEVYKKIFGYYPDTVQRKWIKQALLGMLYGLSEYGLFRITSNNFNEAIFLKQGLKDEKQQKEYISKTYKEILSLFKEYHNYLKFIYNSVLTYKGIFFFRQRFFNSIKDFHYLPREFFKTKFKWVVTSAYNFEIQGTSNDVLNICVYNVLKESYRRNLNVRVVNLIYDEVVWEVSKNDVKEFLNILNKNFKLDKNDNVVKYLMDLIKVQTNRNEIKFHQPEIKVKNKDMLAEFFKSD